jgi:hypothetical protein
MSEHSDKSLTFVPGSLPVASGTMIEIERRRDIRYPFTAVAEVLDERSQVCVKGRTSDLGRGEFYIDTLSAFAVGAIVRVRVEHHHHVFEAAAKVTYAHLSMGMGLTFTKIKPEHQTVLNSWMAELTGECPPEPDVTVAEPEESPLPAILNLQQVLNDLINSLVRNRILNENEGMKLLRRMSH